MDVGAVIVEQLESDGSLRTFRLRPASDREMTVAFANEYAEPHSGPFHFLDEEHEQAFRKGFASCKVRKLSNDRFKVVDGEYEFQTSWLGIPTERGSLSYYALSLPEYAIPKTVEFVDPRSGHRYSQRVIKDADRMRFVIYLECRSSHGEFDFKLDVTFRISQTEFGTAAYGDGDTNGWPEQVDQYQYRLSKDQQVVVQQFFSDRMNVNSQVGFHQENSTVSSDKPGPNSQSGPVGVESTKGRGEKIAAFVFGVVFVVVMLYMAWFVPNPTPTQWFTFRVVLALAAAGVGALLPGLISVTAPPYVRAGGALALFVLVFWFNPPKLVSESSQKKGLQIPSFGRPYHVAATLTAAGSQIQRQTVAHPLSRDSDKGPHSFYTESAGGPVNNHLDVCPTAESGWEIDTDPYSGFSYGMTDREHVIANGSNYWDVGKLPGGCLRLYCDGRNGSSNVYIANVYVREKRTIPVDSCHAPVEGNIVVDPGEEKQMSLDSSLASGTCTNFSLQARVEFRDEKDGLVLTKSVTPEKREEVFDGGIILQLDRSGLLDIQYKAQ